MHAVEVADEIGGGLGRRELDAGKAAGDFREQASVAVVGVVRRVVIADVGPPDAAARYGSPNAGG